MTTDKTEEEHLVAMGMEVVKRILARERCDFCAKPWAVQVWLTNMQGRQWLCEAHLADTWHAYRIEVDRRPSTSNAG